MTHPSDKSSKPESDEEVHVAHLLERVRALIALAASPSQEEARTAAYTACALIREKEIFLGILTESGVLKTAGGPERLRARARSASRSTSSANPTQNSPSPAPRSPEDVAARRAAYEATRAGRAGREHVYQRYAKRSIGEVLHDSAFVEDLFDEAREDLTGEKRNRGHISPNGQTSLCGASLSASIYSSGSSVQFVDIQSAKRMRVSQALKNLCPECVQVYRIQYPT